MPAATAMASATSTMSLSIMDGSYRDCATGYLGIESLFFRKHQKLSIKYPQVTRWRASRSSCAQPAECRVKKMPARVGCKRIRAYRNWEAGLPFRSWDWGLLCFVEKYHMNLDWLVAGRGNMWHPSTAS
jgi:hypothetical protein